MVGQSSNSTFTPFLQTLSKTNQRKFREYTRKIPHLVSREQNLSRMGIITREEVDDLVKGIAKNRALGLMVSR